MWLPGPLQALTSRVYGSTVAQRHTSGAAGCLDYESLTPALGASRGCGASLVGISFELHPPEALRLARRGASLYRTQFPLQSKVRQFQGVSRSRTPEHTPIGT
jgi:hypothetical protein